MIEKIISGGQPGAARAALDWAIMHGLEYGGWCPKGQRVHGLRLIDFFITRLRKKRGIAPRFFHVRTCRNAAIELRLPARQNTS
jgi:hypothetical protein